MKLTLAATVATAAASLAYASAFGISRRRSSSSCISTIPPEILQSECREEVILAVRLALEGKLWECVVFCDVSSFYVEYRVNTYHMHYHFSNANITLYTLQPFFSWKEYDKTL